jgi:hypothetical protein
MLSIVQIASLVPILLKIILFARSVADPGVAFGGPNRAPKARESRRRRRRGGGCGEGCPPPQKKFLTFS